MDYYPLNLLSVKILCKLWIRFCCLQKICRFFDARNFWRFLCGWFLRFLRGFCLSVHPFLPTPSHLVPFLSKSCLTRKGQNLLWKCPVGNTKCLLVGGCGIGFLKGWGGSLGWVFHRSNRPKKALCMAKFLEMCRNLMVYEEAYLVNLPGFAPNKPAISPLSPTLNTSKRPWDPPEFPFFLSLCWRSTSLCDRVFECSRTVLGLESRSRGCSTQISFKS